MKLMTRRALQMALGGFWLLDALLQLEPANFASTTPLLGYAGAAMGAPSWQHRLIYDGLTPFSHGWPLWNVSVIVLEAGIGAALLSKRWIKIALAASVLWGLAVWVFGEGMGYLPSGFAQAFAGAPGAALCYAALAWLAWPGPDPDISESRWRVLWGIYWFGAALLEAPLVYPVGQNLSSNLVMGSLGQKPGLVALEQRTEHFVAHAPVAVAIGLAIVEAGIGLGAFSGRRGRRWWLGAGVAVSLVFWVIGQSLGELLSAGATDPGTAPLIILLAAVGWPGLAASSAQSWSRLQSTWRTRSRSLRVTNSSG